jgi:hypothetical protein
MRKKRDRENERERARKEKIFVIGIIEKIMGLKDRQIIIVTEVEKKYMVEKCR